MKTINKPHYRCDYCNKIYIRSKACLTHEGKCSKNPVNFKPCLICFHLENKEVEHFYDNPMGNDTSQLLNLFYCSKKDLFVFPKNKHFEQEDLGDGETEIIPMPKTCDIYNKDHRDFDSFWDSIKTKG